MAKTDTDIINHIAAGGTFAAGDDLSPGYRGELMRLMAVFVDSELAGAAGFVPFINSAPGLKERGIAARIVSEKYQHADQVLALMEPFNVNADLYVRSHCWYSRLDRALDLGTRRVGSDKRLNVFHYPLEGWLDALTLNLLMGTASAVQLAELTGCSYQPLADALKPVVAREKQHAEWGHEGLKQAIDRSRSGAKAQLAVDYWFPRVTATFGRSESQHSGQYARFGLRRASGPELLNRWLADISVRLKDLGLSLPPIPSV